MLFFVIFACLLHESEINVTKNCYICNSHINYIFNMRKFILSLAAIVLATAAQAIPAYRGVLTATLPDGTTIDDVAVRK